jgi:hypothetical protein
MAPFLISSQNLGNAGADSRKRGKKDRSVFPYLVFRRFSPQIFDASEAAAGEKNRLDDDDVFGGNQ